MICEHVNMFSEVIHEIVTKVACTMHEVLDNDLRHAWQPIHQNTGRTGCNILSDFQLPKLVPTWSLHSNERKQDEEQGPMQMCSRWMHTRLGHMMLHRTYTMQ